MSTIERMVWDGEKFVPVSFYTGPPPVPVHSPVAQQSPASQVEVGVLRTVRSLVATCPEGGAITNHEWQLGSKPGASTATLVADVLDQSIATYTPDVTGTYERYYRCGCEHGYWSSFDIDSDTAAVITLALAADPQASLGTRKVKDMMLDMRRRAQNGDRVNTFMVGQLVTDATLSGTDTSQPTPTPDAIDAMLLTGGEHLALRGYSVVGGASAPAVKADMLAHHNAGGVSGVSVQVGNPHYNDLPEHDYSGTSTASERNTSIDFRELLTVGSRVYLNFIRGIDALCDVHFLPWQSLGIEGVTIIPFGESGLSTNWYSMNPWGSGSRPPVGTTGDVTVAVRDSSGTIVGSRLTTWTPQRFKDIFAIYCQRLRYRGVHNLLVAHQPGIFAGSIDSDVGSHLKSFPEQYCDSWASSIYSISSGEGNGTSNRQGQLNQIASLFPNHFEGPHELGRAQDGSWTPIDLTPVLNFARDKVPAFGMGRFWYGPHSIANNNKDNGNETLANSPAVVKRSWSKTWLENH